MTEDSPLDPTMLAMMEIYRRQVTDLKEQAHNAQQEADYQRGEAERHKDIAKRAKLAELLSRDLVTEKEAKITKLEGIIESQKIELQDAREATTAAKEGAQ